MVAETNPDTKTLVDVVAAIAASGLSDTRKASLTTAVHTVARWLGKGLAQLPADRTVLTPPLKRLVRSPARTGCGKQHVKNVKSTFESALDVLIPRERLSALTADGRGLDDAWRPLWDAWRPLVPVAYGPLTTLMRYCSARGIAPEAVDEAVVGAVADWMMEAGKRADRKLVIRQIRGYWNQAVAEVPGWPQRKITTGLKPATVACFPETSFSESFIASLDALCRVAATGHARPQPAQTSLLARVTATKGPPAEARPQWQRKLKPLKASSVAVMRRMVLTAATSLVQRGQAESASAFARVGDVVHLRGLACLVDGYLERNPPCPKTKQLTLEQRKTIHNQIGQLLMAAIRLPPEFHPQVEELLAETGGEQGIRADTMFELPVITSMTRKNAERLEQFTPKNVRALIEMPVNVFKKLEEQRKANIAAGRQAVNTRMAKRAEVAIAVMLLNGLPVRKTQLLQTDMERNMHWPADRKADGRITWEGWQTKTNVSQSMKLAPWKVRLLELYRDVYRPRLGPAVSNTYLFPGAERMAVRRYNGAEAAEAAEAEDDRGLDGLSSFGTLITSHVERETGITINPHLWRHLAKQIITQYDPKLEGIASALLAHSLGRKEYGEITTEQAASVLEEAVMASMLKDKHAARALVGATRGRR